MAGIIRYALAWCLLNIKPNESYSSRFCTVAPFVIRNAVDARCNFDTSIIRQTLTQHLKCEKWEPLKDDIVSTNVTLNSNWVDSELPIIVRRMMLVQNLRRVHIVPFAIWNTVDGACFWHEYNSSGFSANKYSNIFFLWKKCVWWQRSYQSSTWEKEVEMGRFSVRWVALSTKTLYPTLNSEWL